MDGDLDAFAVAGQVLVDRVVQHLEDAVVQPALVGVADVHAGALPDRLEALQLVDLGGVVLVDRRNVVWHSWTRLNSAGQGTANPTRKRAIPEESKRSGV